MRIEAESSDKAVLTFNKTIEESIILTTESKIISLPNKDINKIEISNNSSLLLAKIEEAISFSKVH